MKPWQALLNKAPSNKGKKKQRKRTQVSLEKPSPKRRMCLKIEVTCFLQG